MHNDKIEKKLVIRRSVYCPKRSLKLADLVHVGLVHFSFISRKYPAERWFKSISFAFEILFIKLSNM